MNDETGDPTSFRLYQRHKEYLDKVDPDDRSKALRIIIDSIINGEEQAKRKTLMDTSILISCIGLLVLIQSYLFTEIQPRFITICIGVLVISYGLIGGVYHEIRRTRR